MFCGVQGRKLTDVINEDHENLKYFPGVQVRLPRLVSVSEAYVVLHVFLHY
jgi:hypothetical protein